MKCLLAVGIAISVGIALHPARHPSPAQAGGMQRGVSVQMAVANFAAPMPAADDRDAWIVTVTDDGRMYYGIDPVSVANLAEEMKRRPRDRRQVLYIKSDARASFSEIERVVEAANDAGLEMAVLLTSQAEHSPPGILVLPRGLEVWSNSPSSGSPSATVRVLATRPSAPVVEVNDEELPWSGLQSKLDQIFRDRPGKTALVEADGKLPFAQVVSVIDLCRSTGARVVLSPPTL